MYLGEEKGTAASTDLAGLAYAGMFDFFGELKRILVSLTDVASLVQHVSSEDGNEESEHMDTDVEEVQVRVTLTVISGMIRLRHTLLEVINHINLNSFSHPSNIQIGFTLRLSKTRSWKPTRLIQTKIVRKMFGNILNGTGPHSANIRLRTITHAFFLAWANIFYFYVRKSV